MTRSLFSKSVPLITIALLGPAFIAATQVDAKVDYVKDIKPIFKDTCYSCHGPKKQKGKYRIDQKKYAFKDEAIVPKDTEASILFELICLPEDDPDVMPQDADPLTQAQQDLIKKWIEEGAVWPDGVDDAETITGPPTIEVPKLTEAQQKAEAKAIKAVGARGGLALRVANNTQAIDVNLSLIGKDVTDKDLKLLAGLDHTLVWLNLARTGVTDAGLAQLKNYAQLRRLHLENTTVGDAGLSHLASLDKLEYLNLYGTAVTDSGLAHVKKLKGLKKIYLWQTKVTERGVADLKKARPQLQVDLGNYADAIAKAAPKPEAAGSKPINTTCPVSNKPVDATKFVVYQKQTIGFCCDKCKAAFEKEPAKFIGKVKEFKAPANDKLSIKKVMQQHKKNGLFQKVTGKKASDAERQQLADMYKFLCSVDPPKGDKPGWKKRTGALLTAAQGTVKTYDDNTIKALKQAANCKACHKAHKP